jgi:hypothetical protein
MKLIVKGYSKSDKNGNVETGVNVTLPGGLKIDIDVINNVIYVLNRDIQDIFAFKHNIKILLRDLKFINVESCEVVSM